MKINGRILEFFIWVLALSLLSYVDLEAGQHMSLCPLANLGWTWCPGCGFGRSLVALFHGNLLQSLHYHWFGIPGALILFHRIFSLWRKIKLSFVSKSIL